jgi:hypothetical protein
MGYIVKEFKDGFSFDVFANDEFLQNVIVYNLNCKYDAYSNILKDLAIIGKNLTQTQFKELEKNSLYLGFDNYLPPAIQYEISEIIYQKIYNLFKKGYYDKYII